MGDNSHRHTTLRFIERNTEGQVYTYRGAGRSPHSFFLALESDMIMIKLWNDDSDRNKKMYIESCSIEDVKYLLGLSL